MQQLLYEGRRPLGEVENNKMKSVVGLLASRGKMTPINERIEEKSQLYEIKRSGEEMWKGIPNSPAEMR